MLQVWNCNQVTPLGFNSASSKPRLALLSWFTKSGSWPPHILLTNLSLTPLHLVSKWKRPLGSSLRLEDCVNEDSLGKEWTFMKGSHQMEVGDSPLTECHFCKDSSHHRHFWKHTSPSREVQILKMKSERQSIYIINGYLNNNKKVTSLSVVKIKLQDHKNNCWEMLGFCSVDTYACET